MDGTIRDAGSADVPRMVELSEKKRTEYEQQQPIFWRKARDSASVQKPYFEHLLTLDSTIVLVYECRGTIQGFVIASVHTAPPVYDPGGLTCNIHDFVIEDRSSVEERGSRSPRPSDYRGACLARLSKWWL